MTIARTTRWWRRYRFRRWRDDQHIKRSAGTIFAAWRWPTGEGLPAEAPKINGVEARGCEARRTDRATGLAPGLAAVRNGAGYRRGARCPRLESANPSGSSPWGRPECGLSIFRCSAPWHLPPAACAYVTSPGVFFLKLVLAPAALYCRPPPRTTPDSPAKSVPFCPPPLRNHRRHGGTSATYYVSSALRATTAAAGVLEKVKFDHRSPAGTSR